MENSAHLLCTMSHAPSPLGPGAVAATSSAGSSAAAVSSARASAPAVAAAASGHSDAAVMEPVSGYLTKWTNLAKGWKKRFFLLEQPEYLIYLKRRKENEKRIQTGKVRCEKGRVSEEKQRT